MPSNEVISIDHLEELIEKYKAFLIRTVSETTGRYVSVEHDDEFSIALSAFAEAIERYQPERGSFLAFAGLVIQSRLRTYLAREHRYENEVSLEELSENGQEFSSPDYEEKEDLLQEIHLFQDELSIFSLDLEMLTALRSIRTLAAELSILLSSQVNRLKLFKRHIKRKNYLFV